MFIFDSAGGSRSLFFSICFVILFCALPSSAFAERLEDSASLGEFPFELSRMRLSQCYGFDRSGRRGAAFIPPVAEESGSSIPGVEEICLFVDALGLGGGTMPLGDPSLTWGLDLDENSQREFKLYLDAFGDEAAILCCFQFRF